MNNKLDDRDIVITSAFRTPIGSYRGSLSDHTAVQLGTEVIKKCIEHSKLKNNEVDIVYMGQVLQTGTGQNPARQSLINSGIDNSKTATTINQVCGSGLAAVALGFNSLKLNDANIVIAGGQESMTNSPHYQILRKGEKNEEVKMKDSMIVDGLFDVSAGGSSWGGEVEWTISDSLGNLILEGGGSFAGCLDNSSDSDCPTYGCTLAGAPNYDANANADDGSCDYFPGLFTLHYF